MKKTPETQLSEELDDTSTHSTLFSYYAVPEPASRDIQVMAVWAQVMDQAAEDIPPQHLRAAWEWFKSWGEAKLIEVEDKAKTADPEP